MGCVRAMCILLRFFEFYTEADYNQRIHELCIFGFLACGSAAAYTQYEHFGNTNMCEVVYKFNLANLCV